MRSLNKINVLLTAVGCPGGPSIIQALRVDKNIHIIGTDMRNEMPGKYLVDEFYTVPAGKKPGYIPFMLDLAKRVKADVILPLATFELLTLSLSKKKFENIGTKVCVSDAEPLEIANNRYLLYQYFKGENFIPKYENLKNGNNIDNIAKNFGYPNEKFVVKPFISHGSIGLRIIDPDIDLYRQFMDKKPNTINIPIEMARAIFKGQKPDDILVSEYLPGKEYGVDLILEPGTGKIIHASVRDNGEVFHSEISNGRLFDYPELLQISQKIISKLPLAYTVNLDFKIDKNNQPKLLEINPRLPATTFLAVSAGINLPLISVNLALGRSVKIEKPAPGLSIYSYRGFLVKNNKGEVVGHSL